MKGMQIGMVNVAKKTSGMQLGVFNSSKEKSAVQVGIINYTRSNESIPLGLINIVWPGTFRISYSAGEKGFSHIALKYGSKYTYSFLRLGGANKDGHGLIVSSIGLGGHMPLGRFSLNAELVLFGFI